MTHPTLHNTISDFRAFRAALGTWIVTVAMLLCSSHGRLGLWWTWRGMVQRWTAAQGIRRVELIGGPLDGRRIRWRVRRHGYVRRFPLNCRDGGWRCCTKGEAEMVSAYLVQADRAEHLADVAWQPQQRREANAQG